MRPKASMLATSRMPHSLLLLGGWGGTRKRAVIRQAQGHIKSIFKVYSLCDENTCEELERTRELLLSRRKDALQVYSKGYSYAPTFFIFTFYTTGRCDLGGPCHVTILQLLGARLAHNFHSRVPCSTYMQHFLVASTCSTYMVLSRTRMVICSTKH